MSLFASAQAVMDNMPLYAFPARTRVVSEVLHIKESTFASGKATKELLPSTLVLGIAKETARGGREFARVAFG